MANNYNSLGENVTFEFGNGPTPSQGAVKSSDFVKQGNIWGVALIDEFVDTDNKRKATVATEGVWLLKVEGSYSFGAFVYYNTNKLTFTDGGQAVGVAIGTDVLDGENVVKVRLQQAVAGSGGSSYVLPAATTSALGGVKKAAAVTKPADNTGDNLKTAIDAIIDNLTTAGAMGN